MRTTIFAIVGICLFAAQAAMAGLTVHDDIHLDWVRSGAGNTGGIVTFNNGVSNGGPFWVTLYEDNRTVGGGVGEQTNGSWVNTTHAASDKFGAFYTFCAQSQVDFTPNRYYDIKDLTDQTQNAATVLTGYGAWVYDKFLAYASTPGNDALIRGGLVTPLMVLYQNAIWASLVPWTDTNLDGKFQISETLGTVGGTGSQYALEFGGTIATSGGAGTLGGLGSLYTAAGIGYDDFLADSTNWYYTGATESQMLRRLNGFQLINVQGNNSADIQDQMISFGGRLGIVPEPASLAVWSLLAGGAAGLSVIRRRNRGGSRNRWSHKNRQSILAIVDHRESR